MYLALTNPGAEFLDVHAWLHDGLWHGVLSLRQVSLEIALKVNIRGVSQNQLLRRYPMELTNLFERGPLIHVPVLQILERLERVDWGVFVDSVAVVGSQELDVGVDEGDHLGNRKPGDEYLLELFLELEGNEIDDIADDQAVLQDYLRVVAADQPLPKNVKEGLAMHLVLVLFRRHFQSARSKDHVVYFFVDGVHPKLLAGSPVVVAEPLHPEQGLLGLDVLNVPDCGPNVDAGREGGEYVSSL